VGGFVYVAFVIDAYARRIVGFTTTLLGVTVRAPASGTADFYTRDASGGLVGLRSGSARNYYLFDGLGSVAAVTDATGAVVNRYAYDPYGTTTETTLPGAITNPWRYTGEYQDTQSGLYKIGLRYYQPDLGRWTQRDPLERILNPLQPPEANTYNYVGANPVNYTDPTGALSCRANAYINLGKPSWAQN
jgi:RHS repeat-associated protein